MDDTPVLEGSNYESLMDQEANGDDIVDVYAVEDVEDEPATKSSRNDEENLPQQNQDAVLAALGFTSLTFLIQTGYDCDKKFEDTSDCKDKLAFGVATATISLFAVLLHFVVKYIPQASEVCNCWKLYFEPFLILSLWILWGVAAITLTYPDYSYDGFSYVGLGTGWLMIWSSVAVTTISLYPAFHPTWLKIQNNVAICNKIGAPDGHNVLYLVGVMLCSVTVMWSAAAICDELNSNSHDYGTNCKDEYAWAVICALFSLVYSLVLLLFGKMIKLHERIFKFMSLWLFLWWYVGMAVCTIAKPFASANEANGFFGTWLALGFSALIAARNWGIKLSLGK